MIYKEKLNIIKKGEEKLNHQVTKQIIMTKHSDAKKPQQGQGRGKISKEAIKDK